MILGFPTVRPRGSVGLGDARDYACPSGTVGVVELDPALAYGYRCRGFWGSVPAVWTGAYTNAPGPVATSYVVRSGDTLSRIGSRLGISWQSIAAANGIKSPYVIRVGQVLRIPGGSGGWDVGGGGGYSSVGPVGSGSGPAAGGVPLYQGNANDVLLPWTLPLATGAASIADDLSNLFSLDRETTDLIEKANWVLIGLGLVAAVVVIKVVSG